MPDIFVGDTGKKSSAEKPQSQNNLSEKKQESWENVGKKHPMHLFSSFAKNPGDITFKNQSPGEVILFFARRHFVTNFPWLLIGSVLIFLPFFIGPISPIINIPLSFVPIGFTLFFVLFYYLIVASYIYVNFITWYFNIGLVTDVRIIDVDFSNLVYKNVAITKITLIQDVSYTQTGVLRTLFHYGDVEVQTAGTNPNFIFEAVPQPENIVHIIQEMIGKK